MKYIIKNCPALRFKLFPLKENPICSKMPFEECCKNITDCVLKRIVELCDSNASKVLYEGETSKLKFVEGNPLAKKILKLLEIEEVDDTN